MANLHTAERIVILSDVHIPHHDKEALATALSIIKQEKPDRIILNGDVVDFSIISTYGKNFDTPSLAHELSLIEDVVSRISAAAPRASITYKFGNHENRYEYYIMRRAPELAVLDKIRLESLLGTTLKKGITFITEPIPIRLGKLYVLHGHEVGSRAGINIAISVLRKTLANTIVGHWHKTQTEIHRSVNNSVIGCWVTGCLCNLKPRWLPVNNWNHGLAIVHLRKNGTFDVRNHIIFNGSIY